MDRRQHITPGSKIALDLSLEERRLILDLTCLEDCYARVILGTPADQSVQFGLDGWEDIGGLLVAKARSTEEEDQLRRLLDLSCRILEILDHFTDAQLPMSAHDLRCLMPSVN